MRPILEIQHISKRFQIHHQDAPYLSLRDKITGLFKPGEKKEEFWALNDVSFSVLPGESLGIIGRNGAGKSTLLKILSRITPPTTGRAICRGRIASLLEVGTGFHQELTGRENIYMNGSILGMKRIEIRSRFNEIVDFSGIEKFLDTPLKHYSSGMQLRLAFAVAAHLDPEILIIDEVLAVGDSIFQKKCMDKMTDVVNSGRTILFVSHNMQAVRSLCKRALILKNGQKIEEGETNELVTRYLADDSVTAESEYDLKEMPRTKWAQGIVFSTLKLNKKNFHVGDDILFKLHLHADQKEYADLLFGVNIYDNLGNCVIHLSNIFVNKVNITHRRDAAYFFRLPKINLKPGKYAVSLFLRANEEVQDWIDNAAMLEIAEGNMYEFENSQMIQGMFQPEFSFQQEIS